MHMALTGGILDLYLGFQDLSKRGVKKPQSRKVLVKAGSTQNYKINLECESTHPSLSPALSIIPSLRLNQKVNPAKLATCSLSFQ